MSRSRALADLPGDGLDRYEAGTWTPTFGLGYEDLASATGILAVEGNYRRIGDLVHIWGQFSPDGVGNGTYTSGGASIRLGNLPFAMDRLGDQFGIIGKAYGRGAINSSDGTTFYVTGESNSTTDIRIAVEVVSLPGGPDNLRDPITFTAWYETDDA